jgi:hypothetical protein
MRFTLIPLVCLIGSVVAAPLKHTARDLAVIDGSLRRIGISLSRLENGMKSRRPGGDSIEAERETNGLLSLNRSVVDEVRLGSRDIRRGPGVNVVEATALASSIGGLIKQTQRVMDGWIDSKRMVVVAGKRNIVLDELLSHSDAVAVLADAIIFKLPGTNQGLGQQFKVAINKVIESAISAYKR